MWRTRRRYESDINRLRIPMTVAKGAPWSDGSLAENAWGGLAFVGALGSASKRFEQMHKQRS